MAVAILATLKISECLIDGLIDWHIISQTSLSTQSVELISDKRKHQKQKKNTQNNLALYVGTKKTNWT